MDKEIRQSYLETEKNTCRFLANLLMDAGRIPETQLVLDMLKEEEFFQFIRRDRSYTLPTYRQLDFNEFERKWLQKYDIIMKNLSKITGEYYILNNKKIKKEAEKKRLEALEIILKKSQDSYHQYLWELKADFAQHNKDIKNGKYKAFIMTENARSLQSTLKTLDKKEEGKNAALNFLVHDGKVRMIITTPDSQLPVSAIIEEKKLNRLNTKKSWDLEQVGASVVLAH